MKAALRVCHNELRCFLHSNVERENIIEQLSKCTFLHRLMPTFQSYGNSTKRRLRGF